MILTGKAKEDFEKWLKKQSFSNFNNYTKYIIIHNKVYTDLNELFINALIIEWFDTVGIFILPELVNISTMFFTITIFHNEYRTETGKTMTELSNFKSRQEVTIEAIKKANELYNLKNK